MGSSGPRERTRSLQNESPSASEQESAQEDLLRAAR